MQRAEVPCHQPTANVVRTTAQKRSAETSGISRQTSLHERVRFQGEPRHAGHQSEAHACIVCQASVAPLFAPARLLQWKAGRKQSMKSPRQMAGALDLVFAKRRYGFIRRGFTVFPPNVLVERITAAISVQWVRPVLQRLRPLHDGPRSTQHCSRSMRFTAHNALSHHRPGRDKNGDDGRFSFRPQACRALPDRSFGQHALVSVDEAAEMKALRVCQSDALVDPAGNRLHRCGNARLWP